MMTISTASIIVDALSGQLGPEALPEHEFAEGDPAPKAGRRPLKGRLSHFLSQAGAATASFLVPSAMRAHFKAQAEARHLAQNLKRLEELSPHLLMDIGMAELARDDFAVGGSDEAEQPRVALRGPKTAAWQQARTAPSAVGHERLSAAFG